MIPADGDDSRLQALEFMPIYRGGIRATHSETTRILPQGDTIAARRAGAPRRGRRQASLRGCSRVCAGV